MQKQANYAENTQASNCNSCFEAILLVEISGWNYVDICQVCIHSIHLDIPAMHAWLYKYAREIGLVIANNWFSLPIFQSIN